MYIEDHGILDTFSFEGVWWLPEKPDERLGGIVRVDGGKRIDLSIIGSFQSFLADNFGQTFEPRIILGVSTENKPCTLWRTMQYDSTPLSEVPVSKFVANRLYYGGHFKTEDDLAFQSMRLGLTYLEPWLGINAFGMTFSAEEKRLTQITLPQRSNLVLETTITDPDARVAIYYLFGWEHKHFVGITLKQGASIRIEPKSPQPSLWYEETRRDLEILFTLLVGVPVFPTSITYTLKDATEDSKPTPVEMYMALLHPSIEENMSPAKMPLPYSVVSAQIAALIQKWFANAKELRPIYDLFSGTQYNTEMYEETRFLNLMQAIESFHRRTEGGRFWESEKYDEWCQTVPQTFPADMPTDLKERLRAYLRYGNEFSLRKRLKLLLNSLGRFRETIECSGRFYNSDSEHSKPFDALRTAGRPNHQRLAELPRGKRTACANVEITDFKIPWAGRGGIGRPNRRRVTASCNCNFPIASKGLFPSGSIVDLLCGIHS